MDEVKIREDGIYLNGQKIKALKSIEVKSTAEDGYAEVKLTLITKLV